MQVVHSLEHWYLGCACPIAVKRAKGRPVRPLVLSFLDDPNFVR
ncbi:MAG: hypothetical protein RIS69_1280 [Actinomycetota bacterium]